MGFTGVLSTPIRPYKWSYGPLTYITGFWAPPFFHVSELTLMERYGSLASPVVDGSSKIFGRLGF